MSPKSVWIITGNTAIETDVGIIVIATSAHRAAILVEESRPDLTINDIERVGTVDIMGD